MYRVNQPINPLQESKNALLGWVTDDKIAVVVRTFGVVERGTDSIVFRIKIPVPMGKDTIDAIRYTTRFDQDAQKEAILSGSNQSLFFHRLGGDWVPSEALTLFQRNRIAAGLMEFVLRWRLKNRESILY